MSVISTGPINLQMSHLVSKAAHYSTCIWQDERWRKESRREVEKWLWVAPSLWWWVSESWGTLVPPSSWAAHFSTAEWGHCISKVQTVCTSIGSCNTIPNTASLTAVLDETYPSWSGWVGLGWVGAREKEKEGGKKRAGKLVQLAALSRTYQGEMEGVNEWVKMREKEREREMERERERLIKRQREGKVCEKIEKVYQKDCV